LRPGYFFHDDKALVPRPILKRHEIFEHTGVVGVTARSRRAIPGSALELLSGGGAAIFLAGALYVREDLEKSLLNLGAAAAIYAGIRLGEYALDVKERTEIWQQKPDKSDVIVLPPENPPVPENVVRFDPCGAICKSCEYKAITGQYPALRLEREQTPFLIKRYVLPSPEFDDDPAA
jgi:hypothetical protein